MARTSTYPLYDRLLNGELGSMLLGWRREGHSFEEIAFRLRAYDVEVSAETVRQWVKVVPKTEPAA